MLALPGKDASPEEGHTAAHPRFCGCPQCPTAVEDRRHAGCFLIEKVGSGEFGHDRLADAVGHTVARAEMVARNLPTLPLAGHWPRLASRKGLRLLREHSG
jgi:hypothetical protein